MERFSNFRLMATVFTLGLVLAFAVGVAFGQATAGNLSGTVTDPTGALVPGATVTITNAVSGYTRTETSDNTGQFHFFNIPFNPYRLTVAYAGFQSFSKTVQVNSVVTGECTGVAWA